jgi:signal transduction histidine kinase
MITLLRRLSMSANDRRTPVTSLGVVAVLALGGLVCFEAAQNYRNAWQEMQTRAEEEARVVSEYAERTFQAVDIVLKEVARSYEVTAWTDIADNRRIWRHLRALADDLPQLRSIWMVDQNGYMRLYSGALPTPRHDSIDREYFAAHKPPFPGWLYLSEPLEGKYTGRWFAPVSRAFMAGEHSFRGVVAGAVEPSYYLSELRNNSVCGRCSIYITRQDGTVLLDGEAATGGARANDAPRERLPGVGRPTEGDTLLGGVLPSALWAREESERYALAVLVTVPIEAVIALWWERTNTLLLVSGFAVVALCFLLLRARRFDQELIEARAVAEAKRKAEAEARQDAADANRAKSDFLAMMSHELRTPLNAILGFSEVISQRPFGDGAITKYAGYAEDIHRSGQHLLSLINDILDLSKIEAGRYDLNIEAFDLSDTIGQCLDLVRFRDDSAKVPIRCASEPCPVQADQRAVKQILLNLVGNAVKFTLEGEVQVQARRLRGAAEITVIDTGVGMDQDDLRRALQPFGQVDTSLARKHQGSGLGLPIVERLTRLHGGRFEIESEPGEGTLVRVTLPDRDLDHAVKDSTPINGQSEDERAA